MPGVLDVESSLTDRYQTTVPDAVRKALRLRRRDKIRYEIRPNGEVVLKKASAQQHEDPALGHFLAFLASDIARHPERLTLLSEATRKKIEHLVQGD